jgi:hypothetical protein
MGLGGDPGCPFFLNGKFMQQGRMQGCGGRLPALWCPGAGEKTTAVLPPLAGGTTAVPNLSP